MDLEIKINKQGNKIVAASHLHRALQLPLHEFKRDLPRWLNDIYAFDHDDIRRPVEMKDFAKRIFQYSKLVDYYITVELAKLICLNTKSPLKGALAKYFSSLERSDRRKKRIEKREKFLIPNNQGLIHDMAGVQLDLWS